VYKTNGGVCGQCNSPVAKLLIVQQSYGLGVEAVKEPSDPRLGAVVHLHLHLSHLADALIQSDLQIGAFTL
jgi:hypothetical protein